VKARIYVVPGIITVFSIVVIWLSLQLELSPPMIVGKSMQPRAFPIFLMAINLGLVALLTLQLRRSPPAQIPIEPYQTWGSMVLLVVFYGLTTSLDLFIAIAVVMFLMCFLWGEKRILVALTNALITPLLIFLLFDLVLMIRFPRGILLNWYYG
jgi:putative tricarboxylic transport membrane protein|tara:strand:- start:356 stop:817 length:462 start_codon:yes stop_codon:yes gene_type:complete